MGGSGGGMFKDRTPDQFKKLIREAEQEASDEAFDVGLNACLSDILGEANERDVKAVNRRLDEILKLIERETDEALSTQFGGSVSKKTYVEGLSDVDALLIISESKMEGDSPEAVLKKLTTILAGKLSSEVAVSAGKLAVTVRYPDGMEIQLLPALRKEDRVRVPSAQGDKWSSIRPRDFTRALTRRNQQCGGKLVPTIKLAKSIIGAWPESQQLSGYHIEALAIAAFRGYQGRRTLSVMLRHFFQSAKDLVLAPIRDRTGQSVNVDEYLSGARSPQRQEISHLLDRSAKRMRNASAANSLVQWVSLFED